MHSYPASSHLRQAGTPLRSKKLVNELLTLSTTMACSLGHSVYRLTGHREDVEGVGAPGAGVRDASRSDPALTRHTSPAAFDSSRKQCLS